MLIAQMNSTRLQSNTQVDWFARNIHTEEKNLLVSNSTITVKGETNEREGEQALIFCTNGKATVRGVHTMQKSDGYFTASCDLVEMPSLCYTNNSCIGVQVCRCASRSMKANFGHGSQKQRSRGDSNSAR